MEEPLVLRQKRRDSIPDEWLPSEDFYLTDPISQDNTALLQATDRGNFVIQLKIDPKNYNQLHRMNVKRYGELILGFEALLKSVKQDLGTQQKQGEKSALDLVIVTPAAKGSLIVELEAALKDNDIFEPYRYLICAFKQIDNALSHTNNVDQLKQVSLDNGSEFAKRLIKFMGVLDRSEVDLRYSWAEPRFQSSNSEKIKWSKANNIVKSVQQKADEELSKVPRSFHGKFDKFARNSGKWGLKTEEGMVYGNIDKKQLPKGLDGLTVGNLYTFDCEEIHTFGQTLTDNVPKLILYKIHER